MLPGHSSHPLAPAATLNVPELQSVQFAAAATETLPARQSMHAEDACSGATLPAVQAEQRIAPLPDILPCGHCAQVGAALVTWLLIPPSAVPNEEEERVAA